MGLDLRLDIPVFDEYVTHNLNQMAKAVGLYQVLWHPEKNGIWYAEDLIELLRNGIAELKRDPAVYCLLNPPNEWGNYAGFLDFCERLLAACITHPKARISVSR